MKCPKCKSTRYKNGDCPKCGYINDKNRMPKGFNWLYVFVVLTTLLLLKSRKDKGVRIQNRKNRIEDKTIK